jgi:isopentenyl-diphosphate delta-isomerase
MSAPTARTTSGAAAAAAAKAQEELDKEQQRMMEEECILVNDKDEVLGSASKRVCHAMTNIRKGMLHRAFSVFLFNSRGELLLQQRSAAKITFPLRWTNTCCSHPLSVTSELEEKGNMGVKRAAIRKLEHELGIPTTAIAPSELHYLTRIHYVAESDGEWGEAEVDHILFVQKDVELKINLNEVAAVEYVTPDRLRAIFAKRLADPTFLLSPWFHMIANQFLYRWWAELPKIIRAGGIDPALAAVVHKLELDEPRKATIASSSPEETVSPVKASG